MERWYTLPGGPWLPTVARIGPYRFFFFSNEGTESPHVHVQHEGGWRKSCSVR